ncbi:hypothetical protein VPH35_025142 [Triticum aestivum]
MMFSKVSSCCCCCCIVQIDYQGHNGKQAKRDYHFINAQLTAFHHEKMTPQSCELFEKVFYSRFSPRTAAPAEHCQLLTHLVRNQTASSSEEIDTSHVVI